MYALAALVLIALCLAWTITQEPAAPKGASWKKKRASKAATVKPMPPLPEMTAPTVMPPTEVREAIISDKTPVTGFTGFGGFGSVDGSGLGSGSGGSWLSGVQPL